MLKKTDSSLLFKPFSLLKAEMLGQRDYSVTRSMSGSHSPSSSYVRTAKSVPVASPRTLPPLSPPPRRYANSSSIRVMGSSSFQSQMDKVDWSPDNRNSKVEEESVAILNDLSMLENKQRESPGKTYSYPRGSSSHHSRSTRYSPVDSPSRERSKRLKTDMSTRSSRQYAKQRMPSSPAGSVSSAGTDRYSAKEERSRSRSRSRRRSSGGKRKQRDPSAKRVIVSNVSYDSSLLSRSTGGSGLYGSRTFQSSRSYDGRNYSSSRTMDSEQWGSRIGSELSQVTSYSRSTVGLDSMLSVSGSFQSRHGFEKPSKTPKLQNLQNRTASTASRSTSASQSSKSVRSSSRRHQGGNVPYKKMPDEKQQQQQGETSTSRFGFSLFG